MDNQLTDRKPNIIKKFFNNLPKILFVALIFALGVWVGQSVVFPFTPNKGPLFNISGSSTPKEIKADFSPFWQVWDKVTTEYLEKNKLNPQDLVYGAIQGMVESIGDPYTVFLNPTKNQEFELSLSGIYEGIGIEIDIREEQLVVVAPIDGTPAAKAGVQAGDTILKIDGQATIDLTVQEAVQKIRGKKDTKVDLTLGRGSKTLDVSLTRDRIIIKSVEFEDLGEATAKIRISRFGDNTLNEWNTAVNKFVSGGFKKLVLDLRNDPGGRLDFAVSIGGDFAAKGSTIVLEEDASGKRTPFKSETAPKLENSQIIVLINKGSASASEIVAGALRDLKGVKLIGETSFGKGTIQRVDDLPAGAGIHITFAKWLTPKGTWVHKKGLKPDVEVKITQKDIDSKKDPQLEKAKELLK